MENLQKSVFGGNKQETLGDEVPETEEQLARLALVRTLERTWDGNEEKKLCDHDGEENMDDGGAQARRKVQQQQAE